MIYGDLFQHKIYESVNREAWEAGVGGRFWLIEFVSFQMEGALTIVDHLPWARDTAKDCNHGISSTLHNSPMRG